jgi:hypothetical protein
VSALGTPSTLKPAWLPAKGTIDHLRKRRVAMRTARKIFDGDWKTVLLDMQHTQHHFKNVKQHGGRIGVLL